MHYRVSDDVRGGGGGGGGGGEGGGGGIGEIGEWVVCFDYLLVSGEDYLW